MKKIIYFLVVLILIFKIKLVFTFDCHECKGTDACAQPTKIGSWDKEECDPEICAVWIKKEQTYRGCKPPDDDTEIDQMKLCFVDSCNDFIFPERRAICHTCDGADCIPVPTEEALPCVNYQKDDECYTWILNKNIGYRGCLSDDSSQAQQCVDNQYCIKESPNNQPGFSSQLACVKCEQGPNDQDCYKSMKIEQCAEIPLGREDKCFHIISSETLIRGCYSEKQDVCDIPGSQCQTCSQTGCNVEQFSSLQCVKCDSYSDPNCKDNPQPSSSVSCLSSNPAELACYYKIDNLDNVKRGCVNSLSQAEQTECFENDGNCRICRKNNCNRKVKPLECHKCKSSEDPTCATAISNGWIKEMCSLHTTECAVWIEKWNEETYRGCRPTDPSQIDQILSCGTEFCNKIIFPENRKQCYQCSRPNCVFIGNQYKEMPCKNYDINDECYTFVASENNVNRGCLSDTPTQAKECNENPYCIEGSPNNQPGYTQLKCVKCEQTLENPDCFNKTEVNDCNPVLLGRDPDECFNDLNGDSLVRGCLQEDENLDRCKNPISNCTTCSTDGCNIFPYHSLQCVKCNSNDEWCANNPKKFDPELCISSDKDELGCYLWKEDDGTVERGCVHTLSPEKKDECLSNSNKCKVCTEDACNQKVDFQVCYNCHSRHDENCATLKDAEKLNTLTCENYLDHCMESVQDQRTLRGCISSIETECKGIKCKKCESNFCNNQTIPESRIKCNRCKETHTKACGQDLSNNDMFSHYCPLYDMAYGDICFSVLDENKKMIRGCRTDSEDYKICEENGGTCKKCTSDGCNSESGIKKPIKIRIHVEADIVITINPE